MKCDQCDEPATHTFWDEWWQVEFRACDKHAEAMKAGVEHDNAAYQHQEAYAQ